MNIQEHQELNSDRVSTDLDDIRANGAIVFVDTSVDDYSSLMAGVVSGVEVVLLDSMRDGVTQITERLRSYPDFASIHIVSHGSPGCLYLGNSQLSLNTLDGYASDLQTWLSPSLLLYGCNVAAGDAGAELIEKLHRLTGAEIAASANRTGSAALGGDWTLEMMTRHIEVPLVFQAEVRAAYGSVFATPKGQWIAQGPSPAQNGQVENVQPNDEVIGAIHTVLAHPDNADILYAGAVNGGIWKTTNATNSTPNWTPLTDDLPGNSIGAMEFDPTDPTHQTIVAGIGHFSSFGRRGGPLTGLLKTTDGGQTWTQIGTADNADNDSDGFVDEADETLLSGRNISGVASRGNTILVSANNFGGGIGSGVYRSTDSGATWNFISGINGLDSGAAFDLVSDPTDNQRFYVSVQGDGIFRSDDGGVSWSNLSDNDTSLNDSITRFGNNNAEMAVASNGRLYAAILTNGQPSYIGFTDNPTVANPTWTEMDLPVTQESDGGFEGLNPREKPGGQGGIHFSIIADPNNPNTVYVGGDRQDFPFPNAIGANDFSGRLFRGDTTQTATNPGSTTNINSPQWQPLTHSQGGFNGGGTISNSAPHADSREMTFDANGDIIEVDDGGIYRRTNPQNANGDWFSIIGNLQVTEQHDIAYDTISNIIISGNQDTGTTQQTSEGSTTWNSVSTADGGDVAVSVDPNNSSQSVRYSSFQNLGSFTRRVYDASNNLVSSTIVGLNGFMDDVQFVTPVVVNEVDPNRIAIGGASNVYESFDQGDNVTVINTGTGFSVGVNSSDGDPIVYGGRRNGEDNPDVLYVGSGYDIFARTTSDGALENTNYSGGFVRDLALDRDDWMSAFAIDDDQIFRTIDVSNDNADNDGDGEIDEANEIDWREITGNLVADFRDGFDLDFRSLEFIDLPSFDDAIAVGTNRGIFASLGSTDFTDWFQVGTDLPNVPVWDLDYDITDNVLVAGTLGRGAWLLENANEVLIPNDMVDSPTSGDDNLTGTSGNDSIDALAGNDTVDGGFGEDTLNGQFGEDRLLGGADNDTLNGGFGEDTLEGGDGNDLLKGNRDNDLLNGNAGDDFLRGNADNDELIGSSGSDTLYGNSGEDILNGGDDDDFLYGNANNELGFFNSSDSNDVLNGNAGNDFIRGNAGNDELIGETGRDTLNGNFGDDTLNGGDDDDFLRGGRDNDMLLGETGRDTLEGGFGEDTLEGGDDDDFLRGGRQNDLLIGDAGDDRLAGQREDDTLLGGQGNDWLLGGQGNDSISGGSGRDTFVFDRNHGTDTIADFTVGDDFIGLKDGLTVANLSVSVVNGNTEIAVGDETLAILENRSLSITEIDFISV